MRRFFTATLALLALVAAPLVAVTTAQAVQTPQNAVVSEVAANFTPHVLDGRVMSVAQVGDMIVLGGSFTQVRSATSNTVISRNNMVAFNATTGVISNSFVPNPNGEVTTVIPSGDGSSVFVGGSFNNIAGRSSPSLARITVANGAHVSGFTAPALSGRIKDLRVVAGRLWLAGTFTHVAGRSQPALATVSAATGAYDPYMELTLAGIHNDGTTTVAKIDVTPQGDRLLAIGNFDTLEGVVNHQITMLDLSGATAAPADWQTDYFVPACASVFWSYMRDLDFSPDGEYVVISTTGAYGGPNAPCDSISRFETYASGSGLTPTWINHTGGDTTYAVAITGAAVYIGGHQRWHNNPFAGDRPGAGAVAREGIAALDPANGMPLSWNPGRTRGVGVYDMLATSTGLWVASDTDRIGDWQYKGRIAFMPLAGGKTIPANNTPSLPGSVYLAGPRDGVVDPAYLYRVNAGGGAVAANDSGPDWAADTSGSSPYRTSGSNAATWTGSVTLDPSVPAGTPTAVFNSERWDPTSAPAMNWSFPVAAGTPIEVRVYLANGYEGTSSVGQRVFDVSLDGSIVLNDYDIAADVGHRVGTVKKFGLVSDGTVNLDFSHVVENPLVNAIEIVRTDLPPIESTADSVMQRAFSGTVVGATSTAPDGDVSWSGAKGAFMLNGTVYSAWSDGSFSRRTFDGAEWGSSVPVNTQDLLVPLAAWQQDIGQMTSLFFDGGRMYFTLSGSNLLYYRYFTPENDVVGAARYTASSALPDISFSQVRGMFLSGDDLFFATTDGVLHRADWAGSAPVGGTATAVSGPEIDGNTWDARAMFIYQSTDGSAPNMGPLAQIDADCTDQLCEFSAAESFDSDGSIVSYEWDLGDGTSSAGATVTHRYASSGSYTVTLTVTDDDGAAATDTVDLDVVYVEAPPTASFTSLCLARACTFDASASTDADGPIASYTWDLGDGETATGVTVDHTYAADGEYTVTLTVVDEQDDSGQVSETVEVLEPVTEVDFVASAGVNWNSMQFSVGIPGAVESGDTLLAFFTGNSTLPITGPAGWTALETVDGDGIVGRVWTRVATAADAGAMATVSTTAYMKGDLRIVAYRGAGVEASGLALTPSLSNQHTTPAVTASEGSVLVSYWADKTSSSTGWTLPEGVELRGSGVGVGGGKINAVVADIGPLTAGAVPGLTATSSIPSGRAAMASVVLGSGGGTPVDPDPDPDPDPTGPPTASFTVSCLARVCSFDADASSDPDGPIASFAWDFGDGETSTGQMVDHTYLADGDFTVTLTVTDGQGDTAQTTETVQVLEPVSEAQFVASAGVNWNSMDFSVTVPTEVQAGDTLLAFFTANSVASLTAPDGWTEIEAADGSAFMARVWTRVATAGDAGSRVELLAPFYVKGDLRIVAYRGAAVGSSDLALETVGTTDHTTPASTVSDGAFLISYWADKSSSTTSWTLPDGVVERGVGIGSGGGRVTAVVGDSGPLAAGTVAGLTATASSASVRAAMVSVVLTEN